ncbi:hypothetical protein BKE30_14535 [Alkanindiges hydrocarboniclasticus]|uniref:Uncharacterized protein n=1 Tax=Alkanindiges hydrocarboniclasticus TaxID=1907941 RepID=A0A1S8CSQ5_9GAMM|nr:hypothetical protein [Alkanindiges hydrocarboniclasticus]ONG37347.1 hypothetical protein BKE30_14535 [Alkanindiges hydrocarboniclasticus]
MTQQLNALIKDHLGHTIIGDLHFFNTSREFIAAYCNQLALDREIASPIVEISEGQRHGGFIRILNLKDITAPKAEDLVEWTKPEGNACCSSMHDCDCYADAPRTVIKQGLAERGIRYQIFPYLEQEYVLVMSSPKCNHAGQYAIPKNWLKPIPVVA